MEPERRELPAQVLDLAPRRPLESVGDERVLDLGQLRVELRRRFVAAGQRRLLAGQVRPRPADPLGDEPEPLAVRLVREAPAEDAVGLGQQLGVAGEARREGPRVAGDRRRGGDRRRQPRRDRLVAAQDVVGVDPHRPLGDLGGHGRVAVAVAADPRAPAEERRHAAAAASRSGRSRWPRHRRQKRRPRTRRRPRPSAPSSAASTPAVQPRHDAEQRLVEERERGPDLVERRRRDRPQVGRSPQERDLLAEAAPRGRGPRRASAAGRRAGRAGARRGGARAAASAGGPRSGGP